MESRVKKRKKRSIGKIILIVFVVLLLILGGTVFALYQSAKKTINDKMHNPVESIDTELTKKKLQATEPLNVLLLGIDADEERGSHGRSDAMMVMQLDPKTDAMQIVSIPRDTRTEIIGKGFQDKINHAYAFGGPEMSVATVENFLDLDMDYYITINMDGLKELVDELGTITVHNDFSWSDKKYDFPEGYVELDGDKTMAFVRMRKQDPEGDFGRTKRQRKVIEGIIQEGVTIASMPKIKTFMDVLGSNMETNMDFDDMKALFSGYANTRRNITEHMLNGTGQKIDGVYYLIVPDEEVQNAHRILSGEE